MADNQERIPNTRVIEQEVKKLDTEIEDNAERNLEPYEMDPEPSNADNTALDPEANIHSGSALADPIGRTLENESQEESIDYYPDDVIDQDPIVGGPEGVRNRPDHASVMENFADPDENVIDKIMNPEDE
jgi:hypothetical protein